MKNNKLSGYLTMFVSLLISLVSGYCTVVGMGKVFVSAASVTMFIASVIEIGRVILLYDIHHYFHVRLSLGVLNKTDWHKIYRQSDFFFQSTILQFGHLGY